jgi:hypothetical protein
MILTCPRCSRSNPPEALFCFHDGVALGDPSRRAGRVDPARRRFPMPFVFPTGKACNTFDELALACLDHWKEARDLLEHGVFASFLAGLGRGDLSSAAREAARHPDRDRGLDQLLASLPAQVIQPPKLVVEPGQLNLGAMRPGQDGRFDLRLANQGMGLLTGTLSCEDCPWLTLGDAGAKKKLFQCLNELSIVVRVQGKFLRAANRPLEARLVVESSGGPGVVNVTVGVPILPFPEGVLAGALTPRQVAEKALAHPREAGPLFAGGAVARWYQGNGWVYPVQEPAASGVAAVQQFFEALGIAKPPKVGINVVDIDLEGAGGDLVRTSFQLVAQEKRPVYAHAVSNQPWLEVLEVVLDGRTATINLRVASVPDRPGETLHARVVVTANGRQRFVVPVRLHVTAPAAVARRNRQQRGPLTEVRQAAPITLQREPEYLEEVLPVDDREPARPAAPRRRRHRDRDEPVPAVGGGPARYFLAALPIVFLAVGLFVPLVRDIAAHLNNDDSPRPETSFPDAPQVLNVHFHDNVENVQLAVGGGIKPAPGQLGVPTRPGLWDPSMRFGLVLAADQLGQRKRLTFDEKGLTNNTCVRLDGNEWLFGERPFRLPTGEILGKWPGRWYDRNIKLDRPLRDGRRCTWVYDEQKVYITQTVGLVPGEQTGKLDTCLIHYRIDNRDTRSHTVGLRFLLDTFIGGNDGVPFLIPGRQELCSTSQVFSRPEDVPDFIQARETEDLANPGTIAQIQLRIAGFETPSRVTLGAWPNPTLGRGCRQEKTPWNVPVLPIKSIPPGDSAVTIYWDERSLPAGGSREMAFAYGLGSVSADKTGGQLALTVGGAFVPKGEFTLTAYVSNPLDNQTLTLAMPAGFALSEGERTQRVPPPPPGAASRTSPVTWKVRAGPGEGKFLLKVTSSTGVAQSQVVRIRQRSIFGS